MEIRHTGEQDHGMVFFFLGVPNIHSEVQTGFRIIDNNDGTLQLSFKTFCDEL